MLRSLLITGMTAMAAAVIATAMFPVVGLVVTGVLWWTLAAITAVLTILGGRWLRTEFRWRGEVRALSRSEAAVPLEPVVPSLVELRESA